MDAPARPKVRASSAWAARAAGVALMLAAASAAAAADANDARILMQPEPGAAYVHGRYYLIPQPYATVKRDIEQGFAATAALRIPAARRHRAPVGHGVLLGAGRRPPSPALRHALAAQAGAQAAPVLDQALKTGAITREENTAFRDAIASQQDYADDTLKSVRSWHNPSRAGRSSARRVNRARSRSTTARSWTSRRWWTRRR